jgi:Phytanoyl-CoA dioxygenase (PhyH)
VLTAEQRTQLHDAGVTRISGVADRAAADWMANAVWASLADRGVDRADPRSWPAGYVSKHQGLRKGRAFDAFDTARTARIVDDLLGAGMWVANDPWGPALVTFPQPGPWTVPHKIWHFDVPGRGDPDQPSVARLFGYITDVVPRGGGTVVVQGSHELVRRMVAASPDCDAGSSSELREKLITAHPWFRALCHEGGDRVRQFMTDGDEIDGVRVKVTELTADAGDVVVMLPWTFHNLTMNCAALPRFMVTHWIY